MTLENSIEEMKCLLRSRDNGSVQRFEVCLAEIVSFNDSACIAPLLGLFNDASENVEAMFSLVHAIETFDDATYVRAIVDNLGSLYSNSPQWAVTVHMRILNSPTACSAYSEYLQTLPVDAWQPVRSVLEATQRKNAKFAARCSQLLARL